MTIDLKPKCAAIAAGLALALLGGCSAADLGLAPVEELVSGRSPIQLLQGEVTDAADAPVGGATVTLVVRPLVIAEGGTAEKPRSEWTADEVALTERKTASYSAVTAAEGEYLLHFRWHDDHLYTVTATLPDGTKVSQAPPMADLEKDSQVVNLRFE